MPIESSDILKIAPGFKEKNGIWTAPSSQSIHYDDARRKILYELEDQSFWFQHRNACLQEILRRYTPQGIFLDVGGGNGFVTQKLGEMGFPAILVEPGLTGCENARERGVPSILCGKLEQLDFNEVKPGAIGLFDVIEHLDNDRQFLERCYAALSHGGKLYITVPAFKGLWSWHDDLAQHQRRYTEKELAGLLKKIGFEIMTTSYFFSLLVVPVFLFRRIPYLMGVRKKKVSVDLDRKQHLVYKKSFRSKILGWFQKFECNRLKNGRFSYGTSILAVARKP